MHKVFKRRIANYLNCFYQDISIQKWLNFKI